MADDLKVTNMHLFWFQQNYGSLILSITMFLFYTFSTTDKASTRNQLEIFSTKEASHMHSQLTTHNWFRLPQ
jgi:hypothetical protein